MYHLPIKGCSTPMTNIQYVLYDHGNGLDASCNFHSPFFSTALHIDVLIITIKLFTARSR